MMQPKKTKFRRAHKGRIKGLSSSGTLLSMPSLQGAIAGAVAATTARRRRRRRPLRAAAARAAPARRFPPGRETTLPLVLLLLMLLPLGNLPGSLRAPSGQTRPRQAAIRKKGKGKEEEDKERKRRGVELEFFSFLPPFLCHHHYTFFELLLYTGFTNARPTRDTLNVLEREREREGERERER